mmetsp:Transcript_170209/g.545875  ORF Transcript_170209/g.545875 Transcript_170209/m.545875 type:complete len:355 (+) Transcript_170209:521-1585(+)
MADLRHRLLSLLLHLQLGTVWQHRPVVDRDGRMHRVLALVVDEGDALARAILVQQGAHAPRSNGPQRGEELEEVEVCGVSRESRDVERAVVVIVVPSNTSGHQTRGLETLDNDLNRELRAVAVPLLLRVPSVREAHLDRLGEAGRDVAAVAGRDADRGLVNAPKPHERRSPRLAAGADPALCHRAEGGEDLLQQSVVRCYRQALDVDVVAWYRFGGPHRRHARWGHGEAAALLRGHHRRHARWEHGVAAALAADTLVARMPSVEGVEGSRVWRTVRREPVSPLAATLLETRLLVLELNVDGLGEALWDAAVHIRDDPRGMLEVRELNDARHSALSVLLHNLAPNHLPIGRKHFL